MDGDKETDFFIAVAGPQWGYTGGAGLLALGFWNNMWQYDSLTGYITSL